MFLFRQFMLFITISIHVCMFFEFSVTQSDPPRTRTLVTKLTHYLSLDSPFSKANNLSGIELSLFDLKNSIARASFLANASSHHTDAAEAPVWSSHTGGFVAQIKVGSNLVDQRVYMDTGSGLLWINCEPCGLSVPEPIFQPRKSTTFRNETCYNTTLCVQTGAVQIECDGQGRPCRYFVRYKDNTKTNGYLGRESFKFPNTDETLTNIGFGCSRITNMFTNGVMGLNNNRVSILSQLGSMKFGYCIGNISDMSYSHSMLAIGNDIEVMGGITPISVEDKYYLNVIGIQIGGSTIEFDPAVFKRNSSEYTGGMVVDTGSTYTFIPRAVLKAIQERIENVMIQWGMRRVWHIKYNTNNYTMMCYEGLVTRDLTGFPIIDFEFEAIEEDRRGPTMSNVGEMLFRQVDDKHFCSVLLPMDLTGAQFSILGNMMQQYYYITYDLAVNQFSFMRINCDQIKALY
ncbi:hypothetical protein CASFOL_041094 [Castilleja foliolosa]|uniref:Peptidase A1 domain-containing protein n=1 Tax=Castilleja foliolosa TaxID=1961234 RepID=A0ABD3BDG9_9LAMI